MNVGKRMRKRVAQSLVVKIKSQVDRCRIVTKVIAGEVAGGDNALYICEA